MCPQVCVCFRRKVEDLCRDLVVNNDHIHVVEMRLRNAIAKEQCCALHNFFVFDLQRYFDN